jgi:lambda family phage portal protein
LNALDRLVAAFSPETALRRAAARRALAYYEAAEPSRTRKVRRSDMPINDLVERSTTAIRAQVRSLERNHDLARGALRVLVNNTIGPTGIGVEPQPRRADGSIHEEYAKALREAWTDWQLHPEVTGRFTWAKTQRALARAWFRDGEAFAKDIIGAGAGLQHNTRVPYSIEVFEADLCPVEFSDSSRGIRQGIEMNGWGRPLAYWLHKADPRSSFLMPTIADLARVPAERVVHLATFDRIGQLRGVSDFASVIARLDDVKDYEESERVAAKIAAMLTAYVKKGGPEAFQPSDLTVADDGSAQRELRFSPGMVIDGLQPGEDIGLIDSTRPNPNLVTFRQGQLRAVAAGIGASYSSISRDYNGTYSAQRQELVEQWVNYAVLTDDFAGMVVQPTWATFVQVADMGGIVPRPRDVPAHLADDALFLGQSMPWIDPLKEANAWEKLVRAGFASEVEVMRRRGVNPADVLEQITAFRSKTRERGLRFASDAAHDGAAAPVEDDQEITDAVAAVLRRAGIQTP